MYKCASNFVTSALRAGIVLSLTLLVDPGVFGQEAERRPVLLDVVVPAEATVEVDGHRTQASGETRHFESGPVEVGKKYAYTVKVTWHRITVIRRARLQTGAVNTLDFREELLAQQKLRALPMPELVGSFHLLAPAGLTLTPGEKAVLPVRVRRDHFVDPIRIHFEDLPSGITIADVTLEAGENRVAAVVQSTANAAAGQQEIRVVATSGDDRAAEAAVLTILPPRKVIARATEPVSGKKPVSPPATLPEPQLRVAAKGSDSPAPARPAEPKPQSHPAPSTPPEKPARSEAEAPPAAGPVSKLRVQAPAKVLLQPGRARYIEVEVSTSDGAPLTEKPIVEVSGREEDRVTGSAWTASAFTPGSASYTLGLAVRAAADARDGERVLKVRVTVGQEKGETAFPVRVESPAGP